MIDVNSKTDPPSARPNGLGFYLDSHDMQQPPGATAAKMLRAGATWAGVLIMSVDGRRQPIARIRAVVAACRDAHITPWLFGFPPPATAEASLMWFLIVAADVACPRVLLDLEPFDEDGDHEIDSSEDWAQADYDVLITGLRAAKVDVIVSIFRRARWERMKWRGVHVAIQAYKSWQDARTLAKLLTWTRELDGVTEVSLTGETYVGNLEHLHEALEVSREFVKETEVLSIWSLHTTNEAECAALLEYVVRELGPPTV